MLRKLRTVFLKKEPALNKEEAITQISLIHDLSEAAKICIKIPASREFPYPFSPSEELIQTIIDYIKSVNSAEICIITEILEQNTVSVKNPCKPVAGFVEFKVSKLWLEADLRIVISNIQVHSHHFDKSYKGIVYNLHELLPLNYYKVKGVEKNIRTELFRSGIDQSLTDLWNTLKNQTPFYTLVDIRNVGITNEHSFFLHSYPCELGIVCSYNTVELERRICEKVGMPYYPQYCAVSEESE
jgi:hypothetical protein